MKTNSITRSSTPVSTLSDSPRKRPVQDVRLGYIKAAIWENSVSDIVRYNVTFSRIYKDQDEWKSSDTFGRDDLLVLAKVADQAHTWICTAPKPDRESAR